MKRLSKKDGKYVETWMDRGNKSIYVFDIDDMNDLNSMVGLAKNKNNNEGTVLYRGQSKLFKSLLPKIERDDATYSAHLNALLETLDNMCGNKLVNEFFKWDDNVVGWELYIKTALEAVLQHYGAITGSLDFVDNHWSALWFALNRYDSASSSYINRYNEQKSLKNDTEDSSGATQSIDDTDYGYLFLYLADTNVSEIGGLYFGKDSYTIDLRKTLPPSFLRPMSQHGWVVKEKKSEASPIGKNNHYFDNNVVGILRIKLCLIDEMLGNGKLLSQQNFFPSPTVDKGYDKLLSLEKEIFAQKMLEEYKS